MRKVYQTKEGLFTAANGIDLHIPAGKMTALLGPSGSGDLLDISLCVMAQKRVYRVRVM